MHAFQKKYIVLNTSSHRRNANKRQLPYQTLYLLKRLYTQAATLYSTRIRGACQYIVCVYKDTHVGRSFTADAVVGVLAELMACHGVPTHIRSDNGSEFIAEQMQEWLFHAEVNTLYIEPGAPWQNGYAESFNSRLRDEFLEMNYFSTLSEAQQLAKRRQEYYNEKRPHTSLGNRAPKEFAEHCLGGCSASLRSAPQPPRQCCPEVQA